MLRFRITDILESKGINNPYRFFLKLGFSPSFATRCANGKIEHFKLSQINKLCLVLKCTPNDLLEWVPDKNEQQIVNHPLNTLERKEKPINLVHQISQLSYEQVMEMQKIISKINYSNTSNPPEQKK